MGTREESACPRVEIEEAELMYSEGKRHAYMVVVDGAVMAVFPTRSQANTYANTLKGGC